MVDTVVHFQAGSTIPVPVCTAPNSMDRTSRCNKVDTVRLYASYRLNLLLPKGQRCVHLKLWRIKNELCIKKSDNISNALDQIKVLKGTVKDRKNLFKCWVPLTRWPLFFRFISSCWKHQLMETGFMMENWFAQLAHSSAQTARLKEEN